MQQISVATITTWNQVMNQINKIEKKPGLDSKRNNCA